MGLLHVFDAAIRPVLLHSLNEELCLLGCVVNIRCSTLGLVQFLRSAHLSLEVNGLDRLLDSDIERRLSVLVQHEEVVREVGQLVCESRAVGLVTHELMHCRISVLIASIVMGVDQVALDVVEGLQLDPADPRVVSVWPHVWVNQAINGLANHEDRDQAQILDEHQGQHEHCQLGHPGPLGVVVVRSLDNYHRDCMRAEFDEGLHSEAVLEAHELVGGLVDLQAQENPPVETLTTS